MNNKAQYSGGAVSGIQSDVVCVVANCAPPILLNTNTTLNERPSIFIL
jgi:hypothetical protein